MSVDKLEVAGKQARQRVTVRVGLDAGLCQRLVKDIKGAKLKVQIAVQGDQVRVSDRKRDDLQQVIALLGGLEVDMPLQYVNLRD